MAHKVVTTGSPFYLAQKLTTTHPYRTRKASTGSIRLQMSTPAYSQHNFTINSFTHRASKDYNSLQQLVYSKQSLKLG